MRAEPRGDETAGRATAPRSPGGVYLWGAPGGGAASGASGSCPRRTRATSGSTSRAIPSTRPPAGSSTCSATATATRPARCVYEALWGRDRDGEREGLRAVRRLARRAPSPHPGMHVYHYAAYERTALTRLMGEHGTRETEIDALLRAEVLVDLYRVVKQALRASVRATRSRQSRSSTGSCAPPRLGRRRVGRPLRGVDRDRRGRAARRRRALQRGGLPLDGRAPRVAARIRPADLPWREPPEARARAGGGPARRRAGGLGRAARGAEEGVAPTASRHLVDYHQREARPQWWAWFRWPQLDDDELVPRPDGDRRARTGTAAAGGRGRATRTG